MKGKMSTRRRRERNERTLHDHHISDRYEELGVENLGVEGGDGFSLGFGITEQQANQDASSYSTKGFGVFRDHVVEHRAAEYHYTRHGKHRKGRSKDKYTVLPEPSIHRGKTYEPLQQNYTHLKNKSRSLYFKLLHDFKNFSEWTDYMFENAIASYPFFPFMVIAIGFIISFLLLGFLWYWLAWSEIVDGETDGRFGTERLMDAIYFSLLVLTNGDIDADILPKTNAFRGLYFLMIIVGLVLFAILIGFISDVVRTYMDSLNEGTTRVVEKYHAKTFKV